MKLSDKTIDLIISVVMWIVIFAFMISGAIITLIVGNPWGMILFFIGMYLGSEFAKVLGKHDALKAQAERESKKLALK